MSGKLDSIWAGPGESQVPEIIIWMTCLTTAAIIFTLLRFVSRVKLVETGLWWDDWLCLGALVIAVVYFGLQLSQLPYGLGRHLRDLPPNIDYTKTAQIFPAIQITYFAALGVIKCSILCFILRLDGHRLRIPVYVVLAFVISSTIAICVADALQCWPVEHIWDPSVDGSCFNRTNFWTAAALVNILSDIVIYLLPIPTLWRVQRPLRQRLALVFVFGVGMFVVVIGFLRLKSLKTVSVTKDPTWDNVASDIWSSAELNMAIVVACMPSFKPLAVAVWNRIRRRGKKVDHRTSYVISSENFTSKSSEALELRQKSRLSSTAKQPDDYYTAIFDPVGMAEADVEKHGYPDTAVRPISAPFTPTRAYLPRSIHDRTYDAYAVTSQPQRSSSVRGSDSDQHHGGIVKTTDVTVASSAR